MSLTRPLIALTLAVLAGTPAVCAAADWPTRPITLVVPFPAGGGNDNVARLIGPGLGQALGQAVVVENRPGAGGTLGAALVAKAPADGHTLLICSTGNMAVAPAVYSKLGYTSGDFAPVAHIASTRNIWIAAPQLAASSLKEFIALAKREPGKHSYASSGNGTTPHLAGAALSTDNRLDLLHVPYKGTTPAYTDLASGRVSVMMDSIISALPMVQSGRVKGLGVGTAQRLPQLPEVPTLAEQGLGERAHSGWVGLCAPRGTPAEVVARIGSGVQATLAQPSVREALTRQMAEPVGEGSQQFAQTIATDSAVWSQIVRAAGARLD
ncbi:MAG TPA: tripartite tricarboxylate transporter substrate binding protein [Ottowia sp.]|nr:tripartite tricarboxylate transporter substrate binding protein [Ottowia sp.]